jgi:hypothetical protein
VTVREAIELLKQQDPDDELHVRVDRRHGESRTQMATLVRQGSQQVTGTKRHTFRIVVIEAL